MDEIKQLNTKIKNYEGLEKENNKYLIKEDNTKLMNKILQTYNKNTTDKQDIGIKTNDITVKIIDLKKKINEKTRLINELDNKKGTIIGNMKKNLYDNNKFIDNKNIYFYVTGIHLFILITTIIGLTNIINSKIVVIVIVVLYIIIILLLFVKYNTNINRNKFNYNEFDIEVKNSGKCNYSPSSNKDKETKKEENNNDLKEVKSMLFNTP